MTRYEQGRHFEYRVKKYLEKDGWVVFRSAGSRGVADLIALKAGEVRLVQCKVKGYMFPIERIGFIEVARELGVMPVVASRSGTKLLLKELKELDG